MCAKVIAKSKGESFKSSYAAFRDVMKDLKAGNYKGCYLLMGAEPYFIDKITDYILTHVIAEEDREFGQSIYYGKDSSPQEVIAALCSYPMMSEKNLVVVKDAQNLKGVEQLHNYFKQPLASTIFVLCYKGKLDKRSSLYKKMVSEGVMFESTPARDYEIGEWITELIRNKGYGIDPVALNMLVEHLGTSLSTIANEVTKLTTQIGSSVNSITPTIIENNVGISKDYNNFELTKALSMRDKRKALFIAKQFSYNTKDHPFIVTLSTIFTHFTRIFTLGLMTWTAKQKKQAMPSDMELLTKLKLSSTFFLREYKDAIAHYPSARSFKILEIIREYDARSKGMGTGSASEADLLRELIIKIVG